MKAGLFKSKTDAVKEANAIKRHILNWTKRKGYKASLLIGVSENNPHSGHIESVKTKKAGRPKKVFVLDTGFNPDDSPDVHIHMLLVAKPADTVANEIISFLNKRHHSKTCWKKDCSDYKEAALEYITKQSLILRRMDYNPDEADDTDTEQDTIFLQNRKKTLIRQIQVPAMCFSLFFMV